MSTQSEHKTPASKNTVPTSEIIVPASEPEVEEEENGTFYHRGFKAESVAEYMYKIRDDSVKPKQFLGTDTEDGIEAILSERQGHSLHEFIDGDDPLRPFIDFDLSRETFDKIKPKLTPKEIQDLLCHAFARTCKKIYPEWEKTTLTIASSSDKKKMSLHISTFGLRLKNITACALFTELVRKKLPVSLQSKDIVDNIANKRSFSLRLLGTPKFVKETNEHVRIKKPLYPKDSSVFDFMIRPPNDEAPVIDSPILIVPKAETTKISNMDIEAETTKISNICTETTEAIGIELELVVKLLEEFEIRGYELLSPTDKFPDTFPLRRITPAYCPLCDREYDYKEPHNSDNAYVIRNKKSYSFYCHRANNNREPGSRKLQSKKILMYSEIM
jgi:hypothetical protein